MFNDITSAQWLWYFYNFREDQSAGFEEKRDLVEYHASFIEPEAVRKIRESRDQSVEVPSEEFIAGIEYMFGRKININKEKKNSIESQSIDPGIAAKMSEMYKKEQLNYTSTGKLPKTDLSHWLNIDLE